MAKNPLYKKLVDLGEERLAGYKGRMRPRHESKAVIDAIWPEIESMAKFYDNAIPLLKKAGQLQYYVEQMLATNAIPDPEDVRIIKEIIA